MIKMEVETVTVKDAKPTFQCPKCPRQFNQIGFFKCHFYRVHPEFRLTSFTPDVQNIESPSFKSTPVEKISYCKSCLRSFKTDVELKDHKCEKQEPSALFKCDTCGKQFLKKQGLLIHRARAHADKNELADNSQVDGDSPFSSEGEEEEEIDNPQEQNSKEIKSEEKVVVTIKKEDEFTCKICNKMFGEKSTLSSHLLTHTESLFKCEECSKIFTKSQQLETHMQIHKKAKAHLCKICNIEFPNKSQLEKHKLTKHTFKNPCDCEICGLSFSDTQSHKRHLEVHHKESKAYICPVCNEEFSRQVNLSRHASVHRVKK